MKSATGQRVSESMAIVIDNGSDTCRAGVAGEDSPRRVFPELAGKPKVTCVLFPIPVRDQYIGDEAQSKAGILRLSYPIQYGLVQDWEQIEAIWHYTFFNELRYNPETYPILVTESPYNPDSARARLTEYFFEDLHSPALYLANVAALPLFMTGCTSGIVLDSGHTVTRAAAVFEGHLIPSSVHEIRFGGRDLTERLMQLEQKRGYIFLSGRERGILAEIKTRIASVALDFNQALKECAIQDRNDKNFSRDRYEVRYDLPDGISIFYCERRFQVAECLFQPTLAGKDFREAIHTLPWMSLQDCDLEIQPTMASNIVLSGGSTLIPGLPERLERELRLLLPSKLPLRVVGLPERGYGAWLGGSIFASLSAFQNMLVTLDEYNEYGPSIIRRKCY